YIGVTEVTNEQVHAILGEEWPGVPAKKPAVRIPREKVRKCIDRYNRWLEESKPLHLPRVGSEPGNLRHPSEGEWEFAARGGSPTSTMFSRQNPFDDSIERCEWVEGTGASEPKNVGTNKPHPCRLYDLLGNVSEMTDSPAVMNDRLRGFIIR